MSISRVPDLNLYKALAKPSTSFFKFIKTCLSPPKMPKESIQVAHFFPHPVRCFTLDIPHQFLLFGISYNYVHVGAIQLALTSLDRRVHPVATRMALLDSRYKNYQHGCLRMVEITLNSGAVVLTLFPTVTTSMRVKLIHRFPVQIQIT